MLISKPTFSCRRPSTSAVFFLFLLVLLDDFKEKRRQEFLEKWFKSMRSIKEKKEQEYAMTTVKRCLENDMTWWKKKSKEKSRQEEQDKKSKTRRGREDMNIDDRDDDDHHHHRSPWALTSVLYVLPVFTLYYSHFFNNDRNHIRKETDDISMTTRKAVMTGNAPNTYFLLGILLRWVLNRHPNSLIVFSGSKLYLATSMHQRLENRIETGIWLFFLL